MESGGFVRDSPWASGSGSGGSSSAHGRSDGTAASARRTASAHRQQDEAIQPLRMTSKQETRLMNYLDDEFNKITRGYAKRYESASQLQTLPDYISSMESLLGIILKIPPYGNSAALLVSYLLRATSDLADAVPNYVPASEVPPREQTLRFRQVQQQLAKALSALDALDRAWNAVLCGEQCVFENALRNAREGVEEAVFGRRPAGGARGGADGSQDSVRAASTEQQTSARYMDDPTPLRSAVDAEPARRDSVPILGSKGIRTVGQTDRVRLRNIIVLAKETLFAWMRESLNAPVPPRLVDEVTGARAAQATDSGGEQDPSGAQSGLAELLVEQGNLAPDLKPRHQVPGADDGGGGDATAPARAAEAAAYAENLVEEEEEEEELAEVGLAGDEGKENAAPEDEAAANIGADDYRDIEDDEAGRADGGSAEERVHFKELFDRKLDPDASDEDDPPAAEVQPSGKHGRSRSASPTESKRQRGEAPAPAGAAAAEDSAGSSPEAEHAHRRSAMPEWDLAFARLFRRTLQTLSEIGEELGKESRKDAGGEP